MMDMRVTTNGHRREMLTYYELSESERGMFDYVSEDERYDPRFVVYRGSFYDVNDSQRITVAPRHESFGFNVPEESPLTKWHGIATESFWTATVFRLLGYGDGEPMEDEGFVVVGTAISD